MRLSINEYRPNRHEGSKEERIAAALEHRYDNLQMWHHEGGWTPTLEDELIAARPPHDDVKDTLASAMTIAVPPARVKGSLAKELFKPNATRSRFGGVSYR